MFSLYTPNRGCVGTLFQADVEGLNETWARPSSGFELPFSYLTPFPKELTIPFVSRRRTPKENKKRQGHSSLFVYTVNVAPTCLHHLGIFPHGAGQRASVVISAASFCDADHTASFRTPLVLYDPRSSVASLPALPPVGLLLHSQWTVLSRTLGPL